MNNSDTPIENYLKSNFFKQKSVNLNNLQLQKRWMRKKVNTEDNSEKSIEDYLESAMHDDTHSFCRTF